MADRTLVVKLVGDERDLLRAYGKSSKATKDFGRTTDTTLARADKRFRSLKGVGAGFAGGLIASEVFSQLRRTIDVAAESQAVLTQTRQALAQTGVSWSQYGQIIEDTTDKQSKLGFDDEALLQTFTNFQRITEDVGASLRANNLAMDIARARNIKLEAAANIVTKAMLGQSGALRRVGIDAEKGADKTELLRLLTVKFGGSAKAAATDASTANERLAVSMENVQEKLGKLLLPTTTKFANEAAKAADNVDDILGGLKALSQAKIPVLNIPINFELPGTDTKVGALLRKAFGETNPITGRTSPAGQIRTARQVVERVAGESPTERAAKSIIAAREIHDRPIIVQVELDGEAVGRSTKKFAQKDRRRNPRQKRGPNAS